MKKQMQKTWLKVVHRLFGAVIREIAKDVVRKEIEVEKARIIQDFSSASRFV